LSALERRALVADYDRALNELARASWLPDSAPDKEPFACEKHPDWRPPRRLPGAPLPPASHCPYCAEESGRRPVGPPVYLDGGLPVAEPTPVEELAQRKWRKLREQEGSILAGSLEEEAALARIDLLRQEEEEQLRGGRVVYYRPFGNPNGGGPLT